MSPRFFFLGFTGFLAALASYSCGGTTDRSFGQADAGDGSGGGSGGDGTSGGAGGNLSGAAGGSSGPAGSGGQGQGGTTGEPEAGAGGQTGTAGSDAGPGGQGGAAGEDDAGAADAGPDGASCDPDLGDSCGSCGGTVQCNGECSVPTPTDLGDSCGSCGGTVQCNGECSVPTPTDFGDSCGSCGGTVECGGTCSVATPADFGTSCGGPCGGSIQCNGACSCTSMVAWYTFQGNANDSTTHNNHGSVSGATLTTNRFGTANSAYSFNGTSNKITVAHSASLAVDNFQTGYTLSAWIYPTSVSGGYRVIATNTSAAITLRLSNDRIETCHRNAAGSTGCGSGSCTAELNQWAHVAVTWNATTGARTTYKDGTPCNTSTSDGLSVSEFLSTNGMAIGGSTIEAQSWFFAGKIDSVRLYNHALNATEIAALLPLVD